MDFLKDLYEKIKQAVGFSPQQKVIQPMPAPSSVPKPPMSIPTQTPTLSVSAPKPSSFNLKNFLGNVLSTGGNIIKKEVIEPLWEGPGMPELRKVIADFPLFREPIKSAKQTLEGAKKELYYPSPNIIGFTKNVGVPLAKTALEVFGLSKIPRIGYKGLGLLATLGAVLSPKGQRLEGAKKMLETSPRISAVGSFTNPVISSVSQSVGSKFATELGRQVATRGTSALLNIPETMIYRKALTGKADYHLSDLPSDILFGSLTNAPVSSVSKLDDITKNIKEAKKEIKSIKTIPNSIEQMVSDLARSFKKKAGEEVSINLSDIKNVSQDVIDKLKRGESIVGRNYSIMPEKAFGKPTGKITIILEENFKPIKSKTIGVNLNKIKVGEVSSKPEIKPEIKPEVNPPANPPLSSAKEISSGEDIIRELPSSEIKKPVDLSDFSSSKKALKEEITTTPDKSFEELIKEKLVKEGKIDLSKEAMNKTNEIINRIREFSETKKSEAWYNKIPALNKVLKEINIKTKPITKTFFSDPEVDKIAQNTYVGVLNGLRETVEIHKNEALKEVKKILGRSLTEEEFGLALRGEIEKFAELSKQGGTTIKIGEDLLKDEKAKAVYKAIKPVADDIAATVIASYKILDDWVADGWITREEAKKISLSGVDEFVENFGKYLRTYYDNDVIYQRVGKLDQQALAEFAIRNSSAKRKLTLEEWGYGYLKTLEEEGIPLTKETIPEDLIEAVRAGDKGAIDALGERVKEAAGYIVDGEKALNKTMNYLSRNLYNLNLLSVLRGRDDLVSKTPKEGFIKIQDVNFGALNNMFVRKDIYDEIKDIHTFMKEGGVLEDIGRLYMSAWKMGATSLRPTSYFRNWFYGFFVQNTLGGNSPLNPANLPNFLKGAKDYLVYAATGVPQSKELKEFLSSGGAGGHYTQETVEVIKFLAENISDVKNPNALRRLASKAAKVFSKVSNISEVYSAIDALNKYTYYLSRLKKGYTPVQAVLEAQFYLNNYALNPKFIREVSRSAVGGALIPFISFTAANIPVVLQTAATYPHRLALVLSLPLIIKSLFYLTNSKTIGAISELVTPSWQFHNPNFVPVGIDEENKKIEYIDFSNLLNNPIRTSPEEMAVEVIKWLGGTAIMPSGITSGIWQGATGKDIWGREIPEEERPLAFMKSLPGGIVLSDLREIYKAMIGAPSLTSGKVKTPKEAILKHLIGIPFYRYGSEQFKSNVNGVIIEYQDSIRPYTKALQNPEVPLEQKRKAIEKIKEKQLEYYDKLKEVFRAEGILNEEEIDKDGGIINTPPSSTTKDLLGSLKPKKELETNLQNTTPLYGVSLKVGKRGKVKVPKLKLPTMKIKIPEEEKGKLKNFISIKKISPPPKTSSYRKYLVNIKKINRR